MLEFLREIVKSLETFCWVLAPPFGRNHIHVKFCNPKALVYKCQNCVVLPVYIWYILMNRKLFKKIKFNS